jgi:hypothetical protein
MLGEDLFLALAYAHEQGFQTRIVTNGYWGASQGKAKHVARRLREGSLNEVNISTGRDHAEFVSIDAVLAAATAVINEGIFVLITVEQDTKDSNIVTQIITDERFKKLAQLPPEKFRYQINSWMKFNEQYEPRKPNPIPQQKENTPCNQLFSNVVVTPHGNISACCGLTFEHIPELRIGTIKETGLKQAFNNGLNDFIKIWIHTDGPDGVVRKVYDDNPPPELISEEHMCDTCARMHKCEKTRSLIRKRYVEFMPDVMIRYTMRRIVEEKYFENLY